MTSALLVLAWVLSAESVKAGNAAVQPDVVATSAMAATTDQKAVEQAPPPPAQPKREVRRRGSMVGYIDDGTITSHVRVRFDGSGGGHYPDRAEFFYAKCGCYQGLATADPPAFDPNAPGPAPGVLTDYDARHLYLEGQYAWKDRVALFVELPVRWLEPKAFVPGTGSFGNTSGLSDISAGVKVALNATPDRYLTVLLQGNFPSGDAAKGLGTNHGTFVPALLYYQSITDKLAVESQIGDFHPLSGSAGVPTSGSDSFSGDVLFYGIGPSYEVYTSPRLRFAPVLELVGWHVTGGFQTQIPGTTAGVAVPVDGTNIVNLKIGARVVVDDKTSFYVGYGKKLSDAGWYNDIVRLEFRYAF